MASEDNGTPELAWLSARRLAWLALGALLATALPGPLCLLNLPFVGGVGGLPANTLEVFSFLNILLTVGWLWAYLRASNYARPQLAVAAVFGLTTFFLVAMTCDFSRRAVDYGCYEAAAWATVRGLRMYADSNWTLIYPPPLASVMAYVMMGAQAALERVSPGGDLERMFDAIYFLFAALRLYCVQALVLLLYGLARRLRFEPCLAALLVGVLVVVNGPAIDTWQANQINFVMAVLFAAAVVFGERRPYLAGFAAGCGAMIKIYPVMLVLPWILHRRWRPLAGFAVACVLALLASTEGGRNWDHWREFASLMSRFPPGHVPCDSNFYSVFYFCGAVVGLAPWDRGGPVVPWALWAARLCWVAALLWMVLRLRRRAARATADGWTPEDLMLGQTTDMLCLAMLVSQKIWPHQYAMMLPVVLYAIAWQGLRRPWLMLAGWFLTMAQPMTDIFPYSFHQLAGLAILLWLTDPVRQTGRLDSERLRLTIDVAPEPT